MTLWSQHDSGLWVDSEGNVYRDFMDENSIIHGFVSNGYRIVKFKGERYRVHRLVADCFIDKPDGINQVDHKNGNKLDNRPCNLEWVSQSENVKRDMSRRTNRPIQVVRSDGKIYKSMRQAAKECGVDSKCIWAVINGYQKTTGGYSFRRLSVP